MHIIFNSSVEMSGQSIHLSCISIFSTLFQINFIISTILKQITIEVTSTISFPLGFEVHFLVQNAYSGAIYEEKYSLPSPREPKTSEAYPA